MKTFAKLSMFLLVALQSTAVFANFQSLSKDTPKNYLNPEMLSFTEKGIYLHSHRGHAFPLSQIQCDSSGYYIAGLLDLFFPQATVIAKCRTCGLEYYNKHPSTCTNCGSELFDIVYIDDGY